MVSFQSQMQQQQQDLNESRGSAFSSSMTRATMPYSGTRKVSTNGSMSRQSNKRSSEIGSPYRASVSRQFMGTRTATATTIGFTKSESQKGDDSSISPTSAISFEQVQSEEELIVLRSIVAREECMDHLLKLACSFEEDPSVEILETILKLRHCSLDVIDAIAHWRRRMAQPKPFVWRETNYLLRMASDLDFIGKSEAIIEAMDGFRLCKRNPFSTMGGLDQSFNTYWELDMPPAEDIGMLLDSSSFVSSVSVDFPYRIRLAEWLIHLEEKTHGRFSFKQNEPRMKILQQKQAEHTAKMRFGHESTSSGSAIATSNMTTTKPPQSP
jgi:hypothetical protein